MKGAVSMNTSNQARYVINLATEAARLNKNDPKRLAFERMSNEAFGVLQSMTLGKSKREAIIEIAHC